jgi:peptidyl-prolyl isomerase E (cyclophilin E)
MSDLRVVFIGGLDEAVREETLIGAFSIFGEIASIDIPIDSQTLKGRGFALIEYQDDADAVEAIENMDGAELFGRTLRVKYSNKRASVQLKDPKKAIWADEIYYRKVNSKGINPGESSE